MPSNDAGKIDPQADLDPHYDDDDLVMYVRSSNVAEIRQFFENVVLANSCTNHHSARIFSSFRMHS